MCYAAAHMPKGIQINCQGCGAPHTARDRRTKYCTVCRLLKFIDQGQDQVHECCGCSKPFAPTWRKQLFCRSCDALMKYGYGRDDSRLHGTCGLCAAKDVPLYHPQIKVCESCVDSPEQRKQFVAALFHKQQWNRQHCTSSQAQSRLEPPTSNTGARA